VILVSFDATESPKPPADLPPIRGLLPSTLIDWPGKIATILFLPGCNLRCGYCHAADLLRPGGEEIPFAHVREYLAAKRAWIDGVVVCGGEPTIHPTLPALCRELKALGMAVKLDTNGTRPEVLARLIADGLIDAVSMDVKTTLDGRMVELAGCAVDLEALERSIALLLEAPLEVEFRTTCCPAYVDRDAVEWIARRVGPRQGRPGAAYVLQRYEPSHAQEPALRELRPYTAGEMEELLATARKFNPKTRLRGA